MTKVPLSTLHALFLRFTRRETSNGSRPYCSQLSIVADINECSSEPSLCGDATCTNVDGSFRCDCERPLLYNQEKCQGE